MQQYSTDMSKKSITGCVIPQCNFQFRITQPIHQLFLTYLYTYKNHWVNIRHFGRETQTQAAAEGRSPYFPDWSLHSTFFGTVSRTQPHPPRSRIGATFPDPNFSSAYKSRFSPPEPDCRFYDLRSGLPPLSDFCGLRSRSIDGGAKKRLLS